MLGLVTLRGWPLPASAGRSVIGGRWARETGRRLREPLERATFNLLIGGMSEVSLTLYIAGRTDRSERAVANLHRLGETYLRGAYRLVVIDAVEEPESAEADRVLATPTLIKNSPPPLRRITGDLSDPHRVLTGLAIAYTEPGNTEQG